MGIACMKYGGVTYISGTVDTYWSRCGLADSYDVRELGIREPVIFYYCLIVDERKHGIASAKIECSYLCEREK